MINDRDPFYAINTLRVNGFGTDKQLTSDFLCRFTKEELTTILECAKTANIRLRIEESKKVLSKYIKDYIVNIKQYTSKLNDSLEITSPKFRALYIGSAFILGDSRVNNTELKCAEDHSVEEIIEKSFKYKTLDHYVVEDKNIRVNGDENRWVLVYALCRETSPQINSRLKRAKNSLEAKKKKLESLKEIIQAEDPNYFKDTGEI